MNNFVLIMLLLLLLFLILQQRKREKITAMQLILRKKGKDREKMTEAAREFINEDCIVYTINGEVSGVIKEVGEKSIKIEHKSGDSELVNADYIIRIRKYPKNKNGKRKAIVSD